MRKYAHPQVCSSKSRILIQVARALQDGSTSSRGSLLRGLQIGYGLDPQLLFHLGVFVVSSNPLHPRYLPTQMVRSRSGELPRWPNGGLVHTRGFDEVLRWSRAGLVRCGLVLESLRICAADLFAHALCNLSSLASNITC